MNKEEGLALAQQWKASGLTQREYAKANGSSLNSLRHYSRILNSKCQNPSGLPYHKPLVEVSLKQIPGQHKVMIRFPSGVEVHLDDTGDLLSILKAVGHL